MAEDASPESSDENQLMEVAFTADDDETGLLPAHPAATVVVFHEQEGKDHPHVLMVRRATTMAFAAGATVFPGGRVDEDDRVIAERLTLGEEGNLADHAARVAAIRETLEETGLLVGVDPEVVDRANVMRAALATGDRFSDILSSHEVELKLDLLVPFARWRPNFAHPRIFDTRFFITRLAGARPTLDVDDGENSELFWLAALTALERADAGEMHIIFPTRRNLERLAQYASFAEAVESTRAFPPRRITPWVEMREGRRHLCIREDCGYPVTSEIMESVLRG